MFACTDFSVLSMISRRCKPPLRGRPVLLPCRPWIVLSPAVAARFHIFSGDTSSFWVAICQTCPWNLSTVRLETDTPRGCGYRVHVKSRDFVEVQRLKPLKRYGNGLTRLGVVRRAPTAEDRRASRRVSPASYSR